ncbi:MAG: M20 family metallo-hydrolase [Spirochaetales bacterium]
MKLNLTSWFTQHVKEMVELQKLLTSIPAIAPESGGEGEQKKAEALVQWLKQHTPFLVESFSVPDLRVPNGSRPNILATLPGKQKSPAFWVLTHLDVVPPGDLSLWRSNPYTLVEEGGKLYGRGVEDNQQGLVCSIFAALSLYHNQLVPSRDVKLLFVSDEELGSSYGIKALLKDHPELFGLGDMFLVPDGGSPDGSIIEIAEKSLLWVKFVVEGKQVHASMPQLGKNAGLAGSDLLVRLAKALPAQFSETDPLFDPPVSTFSPTKKEANVPNVNTIPGIDSFCFDCRVLPRYSLDTVLGFMDELSHQIEQEYGVQVKREILQKNDSAATPPSSSLVRELKRILAQVRGIEAREVGIGGNTVGVFLRQKGYDTVVWSTLEERAHMPDEYCLIDNLIQVGVVMAHLMVDEEL